jgi:hypothetical protein
MAGRVCYHCKQTIPEGEPHDCWTTTEAALTKDLSPDLREAWERLREAATDLGDQRIYASHKSIMFSRGSCYFFVRPKKKFLEVCIFLGREVDAPQIRRVDRASKSKIVHFIHVTHRDQVESPLTDWLREAYELPNAKPKALTSPEGGPTAPAPRGTTGRASSRQAGPAAPPRRAARRR